MKISAILYGFFFAVIYSVVDKPRTVIFLFAGIIAALVAAEKIVENAYGADERLALAKAIICYAAFVTLRLLGLEGVYKPAFDIFMAFLVALLPGLLVYFIVLYEVKRQKP